MKIYDIEKISTHGGSLRIFGCHSKSKREINKTVEETLSEEINSKYQLSKKKYDKFKFYLLIFEVMLVILLIKRGTRDTFINYFMS